ncbi:uncharacterized protein LOC126740704 [Anthonomus grandis grandis]|uniref:uncharacterized protein LOC126740704 n=1 Tax=Anthonomus grandis grandis TaxID=2921223 RepID=UPI0021654086|nr:uncharacterized protein LOC126740704 [Anthonomus grandis grandis]
MNFDNYKKWVTENLISNLKPKTVVVIDNAPYHNKQVEKIPTSLTKKAEIQDWLRLRGIPYDDNMLKPQIYYLIKLHKPKYKKYEIDELFNAKGHEVLRLPPYHPDLNPIELVWGELKTYVAKKNINFNFKEVIKYCDAFFEEFSAEKWKSCCERAKRLEQKYLEKELTIDLVVEQLIINLDSTNSDTESDTEDDEDSELSGIEELDEDD